MPTETFGNIFYNNFLVFYTSLTTINTCQQTSDLFFLVCYSESSIINFFFYSWFFFTIDSQLNYFIFFTAVVGQPSTTIFRWPPSAIFHWSTSTNFLQSFFGDLLVNLQQLLLSTIDHRFTILPLVNLYWLLFNVCDLPTFVNFCSVAVVDQLCWPFTMTITSYLLWTFFFLLLLTNFRQTFFNDYCWLTFVEHFHWSFSTDFCQFFQWMLSSNCQIFFSDHC